ncbi:ALPK1 kinase, partial [Polyodon spathula]|nr:ALPK1 kinase [Polyodon spathula]
DLRTLLEEAKEMKWPFVPERWQYKQDVCPEDKTNLKDIISGRLHELLVYLKASILVGDSATASSIVFLIDRFLYWVDASRKLLQIAKALHKHSPATPIAPQVVIRQARISVNSGKLQKAEYILSSLINNSGATGCWVYHQESDRILVQAVSIQIRGQILQKLGMWYEAAELIWASLVGFNALSQPDKKGLGTSLGLLAGILVSMMDEEYRKFKGSPHIDLGFLEECSHRLLSAAEAAKLALVFSQFTPLFVLSSVIIRGTCLLSYNFSAECPPEKKTLFLTEAKEAFEIGLLSKKDDMIVTSKQELHLLVKAAFSLTVTHRWLGEKEETVKEAKALCKKAMEKLYLYASADSKGKERLAQEIMQVVRDVKSILQVKDFVNSDQKSYVPDSYKRSAERSVLYFKVSFEDVLKRYSQYHTAVCEAFETSCGHPKNGNEMVTGACITAMKTETKNLDTECDTETGSPSNSQAVTDEAGKKRKEFARKARSTQSGELNDKRKSLSDSQSSGSSKSWYRFSETDSSSGWDDLGSNVDLTVHIERRDLDTQCSTDFGDEANRDNISDSDSLGIQKMSLQVDHIVDIQPTSGEASASAPHVTCSRQSSDNANPLKGPEVDPLMETAESTDDEEYTGKAHKCTTSHKASSNSGKPHKRNVPFLSEESGSFELVEGFENETTNDVMVENKTSSTGLNPPSASFAFEKPAPEVDDVDTEVGTAAIISAGRPTVVKRDFQATDSKYLNSLKARTGPSSTEVRLETSLSTDESNSFEFLETEVDEDEDVSFAQEKSQHSYPNKLSSIPNNSMKDSPLHKSGSMEVVDKHDEDRKGSGKIAEKQGFFDEDTEEGEVDLVAHILNSSHSSNSSMRSWSRISVFSSSLPEDESPSFLNSSGDSWIIEKRTLKAEDYEKLLSGVNHSWLLERLKNTGVFEAKHFQDVYSYLPIHQRCFLSIVLEVPSQNLSVSTTDSCCSFLLLQISSSLCDQHFATEPDISEKPGCRLCHKFWTTHLHWVNTDLVVSLQQVVEHTEVSSSHTPYPQHLPMALLRQCLVEGLASQFCVVPHSPISSILPLGLGNGLYTPHPLLLLLHLVDCQLPPLSWGCAVSYLIAATQSVSIDYSMIALHCYLDPATTWFIGIFLLFSASILLKYSKISGLWTAQETEVYIGASLGQKGKQRSVFWVHFLHQEETLGRYVGKEYQSAKELFYHLNDVERQMTAQYYVTEFNKRLYEKQISTQIYFVPSEVLLIMEDSVIKGCISVEPYMLGEFVKLTNNTKRVMRNYKATEYGLAFGHFTYEFSGHKEVVVDLQGWITGNGKGLIYLTDPQIHSLSQTDSSNFGQQGIDYFLKYQHGAKCNDICNKLSLARLPG